MLSFRVIVATHPRRSPNFFPRLTPIPCPPSPNSFPCHRSEKTPAKSNHCHTSKTAQNNPCDCHTCETPRGVPRSPLTPNKAIGNSSFAPRYRLSPIPYTLSPSFSRNYALFSTTAVSQPFSHQSLPHSFHRDGGCTPSRCISERVHPACLTTSRSLADGYENCRMGTQNSHSGTHPPAEHPSFFSSTSMEPILQPLYFVGLPSNGGWGCY